MASTSSSATFYITFQSLKIEINQALDINDLSKASKSLLDLKTQFRENVVYLPAYDERSYDTQIRELESRLSSLRPKSTKFSFSKSKPTGARPNPPTLVPQTETEEQSISTSGSGSGSGSEAVRLESIYGRRLGLSDLSFSTGSSSSSSTIILTDLQDCIIDFTPSLATGEGGQITALHANNLSRCILIIPVEGSILLHSITDCILVVSAHQFRMHDSRNTTVLISIPSMPIIEHCTNIIFGLLPPNLLHSPLTKSRHWEVQDFDWVREGESPNWARVGTGEKSHEELVGILQEVIDVRNSDEGEVRTLLDRITGCSKRSLGS